MARARKNGDLYGLVPFLYREADCRSTYVNSHDGAVVEDLERYLNEIVDPTIEELAEHRTSVRHTFLACVAVFHAVDYLAYTRKSRTLREQFNKEFEGVRHH